MCGGGRAMTQGRSAVPTCPGSFSRILYHSLPCAAAQSDDPDTRSLTCGFRPPPAAEQCEWTFACETLHGGAGGKTVHVQVRQQRLAGGGMSICRSAFGIDR